MDGLVSVLGHVSLTKLKHFLCGNRKDNELRKKLKQEATLLFQEPSPACVKYVLAQRGEIQNVLRLPMIEVQNEHLKKKLQATFIDK